MKLKKGIEKARNEGWHFHTNYELMSLVENHAHEILLDITFWEALGISERWSEWQHIYNGNRTRNYAEHEKRNYTYGINKRDGNSSKWIKTYKWKMFDFMRYLHKTEDLYEAFHLATK